MLINEATLRDMKARAASALTEVPSALRCEALARGFGYLRWRDLLASARNPQPSSREFSPAKAEQFLAEHFGSPCSGKFDNIIHPGC